VVERISLWVDSDVIIHRVRRYYNLLLDLLAQTFAPTVQPTLHLPDRNHMGWGAFTRTFSAVAGPNAVRSPKP
jgi:hypothetical protein